MPDKWAQYAQPAQSGSDKWAQYAAPTSPPASTETPDGRFDFQKSFDENTSTNPNEPLLETGLKSVTRAAGMPFIHPIKTAEGMGSALVHSLNPQDPENPLTQGIESVKKAYQAGGVPYAATKVAGQLFGGAAAGAGTEAGYRRRSGTYGWTSRFQYGRTFAPCSSRRPQRSRIARFADWPEVSKDTADTQER